MRFTHEGYLVVDQNESIWLENKYGLWLMDGNLFKDISH